MSLSTPSLRPASLEPHPDEVRDGIHYPSSDGVEMGEADWHFEALAALFEMLRVHYSGQDAYVASDLMLYYEEGNPRACRAPDCMIFLGVKGHARRSWLAWVEGALPTAVFEIASRSTVSEDLGAKRALYERLAIPEYFLFDPLGDCFEPRLLGYRLVGGRYAEIPPGPDGGLTSEGLALAFYPEAMHLRVIDLRTLLTLPTYEEQARRLGQQGRRLEEMRKLAVSRGRKHRRAARRAEAAAAQVAEAARRAEGLAAEIQRLKALLKGAGQGEGAGEA